MAEISIVIPAYNEEKRIGKTIRTITSYLTAQGFHFEIIVADDGSTDNTRGVIVAPEMPPVHLLALPHRGKGSAVREGVTIASHKLILVTDADLSTPIEELERFLKESSDIVIASRALRGAKIEAHQPRYREIGGRLLNIVIRLFALSGIYDTQCGFKLFKASAAKQIFSRSKINGFGFDVEALVIGEKLGYSITELPVRWLNDPRTTVHPFRDGVRVLADILRIRLNILKGKYK